MKKTMPKAPRSLEEAMMVSMVGAQSPDLVTELRTEPEDPMDSAMHPPSGPDGYVLTPPKGVAWDRGLEARAREWFHNAGLPQSVASGILQQYCRRVCGGEAATPDADRDIAALRQEWGPDWDHNIDAARSVVRNCNGGDELVELLDHSGLGNDVWLIRTLAAVGQGRAGHRG